MATDKERKDALAEWGSPARQPAIWARCLNEAGDDEDRARTAYVEERAGSVDLSVKGPGANELPRADSVPERKKINWWIWAPLGSVGLFLFWAMVRTPSPQENEMQRQRASIEYCWKEQARKSLEPSSQRFIAGACERMEDGFRQRFSTNP